MTINQTDSPNFSTIEESLFGGTVQRRGDTVITWRGLLAVGYQRQEVSRSDFGAGVAMLGHCHPVVSKAVAEQAMTLISVPLFSTTKPVPALLPS